MVEKLRVATPKGEFRLGRAPGSAAGPDLRQLFIGSEGILGIITEVTMRVRRQPRDKRYEGVMFPTYEDGLRAFREMVSRRATADLMRLSDPEETLTNLTMAAEGELKQVIAQLEINAREAAHPSVFVAGWRPFFGWAGGIGFIYATMLQPLLTWWAQIKGVPAPPILNIDLLWVVITGMLGIGGLRTFEKSKGVAK